MKTIATAKPNPRYKFFLSISKIRLEARFTDNGRIVFYDIEDGTERLISEESVHNLFRLDKSTTKQPFLARENREFWMVLNRKNTKFKSDFEQWLLKKHGIQLSRPQRTRLT